MIGFALCHGWGFDSRALVPLHESLRRRYPDAEFHMFDLGFSGSPYVPVLEPGVDWIAIGHSWGFAFLLQRDVPWRKAVALNGFTRFCRRPGNPEGTASRIVDAMLARLAQDPRALLQEFRSRCGEATDFPNILDNAKLEEHLLRLRDIDLSLPDIPLLALATQEDVIVPPALARACFAGRGGCLREVAGDHMQLLRDAETTAAAIAAFCGAPK